MENVEIAKKYTTEKVKEQQIYLDTVTSEDGSKKQVQKVREVEVEKSVLSNNRESAFAKAETEAKEKGYASVSLISEDEKQYIFQLYNKLEEKEGDK